MDKKLDQVVNSCVPGEFIDVCASCTFPHKPTLERMPIGIDEEEVCSFLLLSFIIIYCWIFHPDSSH